MVRRLGKHNLGALFQWKSRNARTDSWKRDGFQAALISDLQGVRRGMPQRFRIRFAPKLHAGRMNYKSRLQFSARGDGCIANRDAADVITFALALVSPFAANGSPHPR